MERNQKEEPAAPARNKIVWEQETEEKQIFSSAYIIEVLCGNRGLFIFAMIVFTYYLVNLFTFQSFIMPSFDIVSKVEVQALENAVNVTTKEITNRFDFKGSHVVINLDKKEFKINIETEDEMKMGQLIDVLISRAYKQGIAPEAFDASKAGHQSGKTWKKEILVKNGLKQEDAKKIVKLIKDAGLKVQAAINDDLVRVTGKKIDDLQEVIQLCKTSNPGFPLQYVNMRS